MEKEIVIPNMENYTFNNLRNRVTSLGNLPGNRNGCFAEKYLPPLCHRISYEYSCFASWEVQFSIRFSFIDKRSNDAYEDACRIS